jgi:hypothetical protein
MKITKKYYSKKTWKLRNIDKYRTDEPIFRFKIFKDGKKFVCCDFKGFCTNKAYAEVFPRKRDVWYYLCKKHYYLEEKRLKWKLPACLSVDW